MLYKIRCIKSMKKIKKKKQITTRHAVIIIVIFAVGEPKTMTIKNRNNYKLYTNNIRFVEESNNK